MRSFVYLGIDPLTGKELRKWYTYYTDREKQKKHDNILRKHSAGNLAAKVTKFNTWAKTIIKARYPEGSTNPNTRRMYITSMNHLIGYFGAMKLSQIRQIHVEQYAAKRTGRAAEICLLTLNQIFKATQKNRYINDNPAEGVQISVSHKQKKRDLEKFEREAVKKANFTPKEKAFIYLIYRCGLRRGEACALDKSDITDRIMVNKAAIISQSDMIIKLVPKTDSGNRSIPIPDDALKTDQRVCSFGQ
jgi:integrase